MMSLFNRRGANRTTTFPFSISAPGSAEARAGNGQTLRHAARAVGA